MYNASSISQTKGKYGQLLYTVFCKPKKEKKVAAEEKEVRSAWQAWKALASRKVSSVIARKKKSTTGAIPKGNGSMGVYKMELPYGVDCNGIFFDGITKLTLYYGVFVYAGAAAAAISGCRHDEGFGRYLCVFRTMMFQD
ncbi:hypothetical protein NPIL_93721 [Nephila pilipes]|uniref:Uncharacterized protein n=1 Tax=Nephila pilipes TaxID=299642 RepID=A0A8X6UGI5_NEPPI|nr:hypothetical protein NPIL_93721 [Nephila pilipes]